MSALVGALCEDGDERSKQECMSALVGALCEDDKAKDECMQALVWLMTPSEDGEERFKQECMSALVGALCEDDKAKDECMQALVGAMTPSEDLPKGTDDENAAAAKIQAVHRGKKARRSVDEKRAAADGPAQEDDASKTEICAALEAAPIGQEENARAEVHGALRAALSEDLPEGTDEENA